MLSGLAHKAKPLQLCSVSARSYAMYIEKPVSKDQRKPLVHSVCFNPSALKEIRDFRFAKEWHIFKRKYEVSLIHAYKKYLEESEEQRREEKVAKRKARREEFAPVRHRLHILQKRRHQHLKESLIIRPWLVLIQNVS